MHKMWPRSRKIRQTRPVISTAHRYVINLYNPHVLTDLAQLNRYIKLVWNRWMSLISDLSFKTFTNRSYYWNLNWNHRIIFSLNIYHRPQRSCGQGNIFTPVCHSVHREGVCLSACWDTPGSRHPPNRHPPGSRHPPEQTPPQSRPPGTKYTPQD